MFGHGSDFDWLEFCIWAWEEKGKKPEIPLGVTVTSIKIYLNLFIPVILHTLT